VGALTPDDFAFAAKALKGNKVSLEALYRAMAAFENGTWQVNYRLAPHLVHSGVLTVEDLYELLTDTPARPAVPQPPPADHETTITPTPRPGGAASPASAPVTPQPQSARPRAEVGVGTLVGGYRLERVLGQGGMGSVFLGEHDLLGTRAAIKVFRFGAGDREQMYQRALREASLAARLQHPNIVAILNAGVVLLTGQDHEYFFIAMPFLPGGDVNQLMRQNQRLPLSRALAIARDVATALLFIHRNGLVHRDVKPGNILLDENGRALLADFGLVKSLRAVEPEQITPEGGLVGTPTFMCPEAVRGEPVTPGFDIYSFGCLLFYLVTGRVVRSGLGIPEMLNWLLGEQRPEPPSTLNPEVPAELDRLILELLEKDPTARPADMAEVLRRLDAVPITEAEAVGSRPAPLPEVVPPEPGMLMTMVGPAREQPAPPAGSSAGDEGAETGTDFRLPVQPDPHGTVHGAEVMPPVQELTLVPGGPASAEGPFETVIRPPAPPPEEGDPALRAAQHWQSLREKDASQAERFWAELPDEVRAAPALAAAREEYVRQQADRLWQQALDSRRKGTPEALPLLRQVLALVPGHREAESLLRDLDAAPAVPVAQLMDLARAGKPQGVPALEQILRDRVKPHDLAMYLRHEPECAVYKDPTDLVEFLLEGDATRERILNDLFGLCELGEIAVSVGLDPAQGTRKQELIQQLLEQVGFRRLALPEGIDSFLRELAVVCRPLAHERDRVRLLGIGTRILFIAERVLKELVHFYGTWLHGDGYSDELRKRGWVPAHAKDVQKLALGSLNQAFIGLADEARGRPACQRFLPADRTLLPASLTRRLRAVEPHRNRVFSHDSTESRKIDATELRQITLEVRNTLQDFFHHLHSTGIYPRKLILDRTVQDRHGQTSYFCLTDSNEEVEVVSDQRLEPGRIYLCMSASNPKFIRPVLVCDLTSN
jgi:tRNA A-37 threonylcarbamoyl transferase component Bud32